MSYKDGIKQLIGGGMDAYHQRAKQRIEEVKDNNVRQNHKISMLVKELDNDYLEKIEEGSVISLDHSKEGMVFVDGLEGNTLVNYATDGSKELILNGDIDTEGTFVTTTEGVDGGMVDVLCEGNTMVNCLGSMVGVNGSSPNNTININDVTKTYHFVKKENTGNNLSIRFPQSIAQIEKTYTLIFKINKNTLNREGATSVAKFNIVSYNGGNCFINVNQVGLVKVKLTQPNVSTGNPYLEVYKDVFGELEIEKPYLLEGDWTNKETPIYVDGMQSVGEGLDKFEILSNNKNLYNQNEIFYSSYGFGIPFKMDNKRPNQTYTYENGVHTHTSVGGTGNGFNQGIGGVFKVEKNKKYTISLRSTKVTTTGNGVNLEIITLPLYKGEEVPFKASNGTSSTHPYIKRIITKRTTGNDDVFSTTIDSGNYDYIQYYIGCGYVSGAEGTLTCSYTQPQIEEGSVVSTYVEPKLNKKEISLNEPLRGLPNGVKDRFVKIGGKWFIERNCGEVTLNDFEWVTNGDGGKQIITKIAPNNIKYEITSINGQILCDKIGVQIRTSATTGKIIVHANIEDVNESISWLKGLNGRIVYLLNTPTYESLEVSPELECYLETMHISNNSIIPCNMKVKNMGWNAIIKPNTQYTVALDTNKSGTIGLNLGGSKVTTANNVALITTPSTLTDDSLRVSGKGVKGSKVRLLEGNKTNWIPSMFEGMKSCFEDKDNVVELKSINNNLIDIDGIDKDAYVDSIDESGIITTTTYNNDYGWFRVKFRKTYKLKAGIYYLSFKMKSDKYKYGVNTIRFENIKDTNVVSISEKLINPNCNTSYQTYEMKFVIEKDFDINYMFMQGSVTNTTNMEIKDLMLSSIQSSSYIEYKSNKIQFLLKEPLRGVNDFKDRFVFIDNKLMIERNCGVKTLNGYSAGENWKIWDATPNPEIFVAHAGNTDDNPLLPNADELNSVRFICDKYAVSSSVGRIECVGWYKKNPHLSLSLTKAKSILEIKEYLKNNPITLTYKLIEPTYEEIPTELADIILECYENGTLFIDTIIPPTVSVRYSGELPMVKAVKTLNVQNDTISEDLNNNIVPYLMDMDYRLVNIQLNKPDGVVNRFILPEILSWLKRDINTRRYSNEEYLSRIVKYLGVGRISMAEYNELEELINGN